jgi:hypothetical protein
MINRQNLLLELAFVPTPNMLSDLLKVMGSRIVHPLFLNSHMTRLT